MDPREKWIGVFDSGVGGISVLRELRRELPGENFLYYGDSANAPYGGRPTKQVRQLTMHAAAHLLSRDVKALVVACNTATAAAIEELRQAYPQLPVIGIEPALKPAAVRFPQGTIGIMATEVTLREEKLAHQLERFPGLQVCRIPAPGLVELVEQGKGESPEAQELLEPILAPYAGKLDALVLGCTHYPFASGTIGRLLGGHTVLLDGSAGTARQTRHCLQNADLLQEGRQGKIRFENSAEDPELELLCRKLLNQ